MIINQLLKHFGINFSIFNMNTTNYEKFPRHIFFQMGKDVNLNGQPRYGNKFIFQKGAIAGTAQKTHCYFQM